MIQPVMTIFGYSLDWWVSAVVIPVGLGVRWYLAYRQRETFGLISSQQTLIQQLSDANAYMAEQLKHQQAMLAEERDANSQMRLYIEDVSKKTSSELQKHERNDTGPN